MVRKRKDKEMRKLARGGRKKRRPELGERRAVCRVIEESAEGIERSRLGKSNNTKNEGQQNVRVFDHTGGGKLTVKEGNRTRKFIS